MKKFDDIINDIDNIRNEKNEEELKIVNDLFSRRKKLFNQFLDIIKN